MRSTSPALVGCRKSWKIMLACTFFLAACERQTQAAKKEVHASMICQLCLQPPQAPPPTVSDATAM
jgi:hypothetical protein